MSPPKDNAYEDGRHYRLYRVPWRWPLKVPLIAEPRAQYEEYARSVLYTRYISYDTIQYARKASGQIIKSCPA